jgi:NADH:ubiquinone oxidoreductase subunit F (NADH-binding)
MSSQLQSRIIEQPEAPAPQGGTLPRLLSGIGRHALDLDGHEAVHGPLPFAHDRGRWRRRERADALIEEVARAGLLGRGGAAFPMAKKMHAVAHGRGRAMLVANGAEGEPASAKDHTLLELLPHLVLDGATVAAEAVGADEAVIAVCESAETCADAIAIAIAEREGAGLAGGRGRGPALRLATVPTHYVAGQECALVNYLDGGPALPTFTPPLPFERGLARRPTLVSNVETLAHLALIARHGAQWFRSLGAPAQPGSALITLSGPVAHPGVYEIELGSSLASLIAAGGGATAGLRGVLLGGYAGSFVGAASLPNLALSDEHLAPHGARVGAGVVALLSEEACAVAETARLARWLADQSSRQCGPCVHGLDALAQALAGLSAGERQGERIEQLARLTARRGACGHPDGSVNVIMSAIEAFGEEFLEHARHGSCQACARPPELPLPHRPVEMLPARRRQARA